MKSLARLALLTGFSLTACHDDRGLVSPRPRVDVSSMSSATSLPAPTARGWAAATVIDNSVYLVGGGLCLPAVSGCASFGQDATPITEAFDPTTGAWSTKTSLQFARWSLGSAAANGKIYAFGGTSGCCSQPIPFVEVYDPRTDQWTTQTHFMQIAIWKPAVAVVDGIIYTFGGGATGNQGDATDAVEAYDPATDTWVLKQAMPVSRWGAAAAAVDGKVYVFGGSVRFTGATPALQVFDPGLNSWGGDPRAPMNVARWDHAGVAVNGKIYAIGGYDGQNQRVLSTVEEYNPATNQWSLKASMPTARTGLVAIQLGGLIYAIGGFAGTKVLDVVEIYDPARDTWINTSSTSLPFADPFDRPDNNMVGNGWLEHEPGGAAEISNGALRITTGSASGDGAKVFRPLPRQSNLRIAGTVRFLTAFSRIWVLVRADGIESLRNGYGFSWRFTGFADNSLILFDNTTDDLDVGGFKTVDVQQEGLNLGQTINFEMLILGDNSLEVRVWAQGTPRPETPTLASGPRTPLAGGSNLAIVESTRDATNGDFFIDDLSVSQLQPLPNSPPTAVACAAVTVPPLPPPCLKTQTSVRGPIPRPVILSASGSSDPDPGDALTFRWTEESKQLGEGHDLDVLLGPGEHRITLTVSDGSQEASTSIQLVIHKEVVVLVHGIFGSSLEDDGKNTFGDLERLLRPKFEVVEYDYSFLTTLCATTTNSIERIASDFSRWLHGENDFAFRPGFPAGSLGRRPINIVAHSMGGLVVSVYVAGLSDPHFPSPRYQAGEFDRLITLGTPYYGAAANEWRTLEKVVCRAAGLFSPSLKTGIQEEEMQLGSEFVWRLHEKWQQVHLLPPDLILNVAGWAAIDNDGIVPMQSAVRPVEEGVTASYAPCKHVESSSLAPYEACALAFVPEASTEPMLGIIIPFLNEGTVVGSELPPGRGSRKGLLLIRSEKQLTAGQEFGDPFPGFRPTLDVTGPEGKFTCAPGVADCVYNESTGAVTILNRPAPGIYTVALKGRLPSGYQPVTRTLQVILARGRPSVAKFEFAPERVASTSGP